MHHGPLTKDLAAGLEELQERIRAAKIPSSKLDESFNLATWNVREFGKKRRRPASLHYIAEIVGQFDLVAMTEVRDDLTELECVLDYLGPYWRVVYSDFDSDAAGNRERIAYVYDSRMVRFTGFAAEARSVRKKDARSGEYRAVLEWWRSPYLASFRAGDFDFVLTSAHIRWGSESDVKGRAKELAALADWIHARSREKHVEDHDIVVLGDFNIPARDDALFKAVTKHGLQIPLGLRGLAHGSNLAKDKRYDQILHLPTHPERFTDKGGVLDFYCGDHKKLFRRVRLSKLEFTYELSDHLPLWIQIDSDISGQKLDQVLRDHTG